MSDMTLLTEQHDFMVLELGVNVARFCLRLAASIIYW